MNAMQVVFQSVALAGTILLCSCATRPVRVEIPLNEGAGRGDFLFLTLHSNTGEELLFAVDTGSPSTFLDQSLEKKLGAPLGAQAFPAYWLGTNINSRIYRAPELYLAHTRLRTGQQVVVSDLSWIWTNRAVAGILGMDCLKHYCLQLDFAMGRARLLNPNQPGDVAELGESVPLHMARKGFAAVQGTFAGDRELYSWIDTGDPNDGSLEAKLFQKMVEEQKDTEIKNYEVFATGKSGMGAAFPTGMFRGQTYTNLIVLKNPSGFNGIGLRFLARHLVTFNFPKGTLHLKRQSIGPITDDRSISNDQKMDHPTP
jgi:hypothetical protein